MSYTSVVAMAASASLCARVAACAATQDLGGLPPQAWAQGNILAIAGADPAWATAWESAPLYNPDGSRTDAGARNDVITDAMILASVQQVRANQVAAAQPAGDGSAGSAS